MKVLFYILNDANLLTPLIKKLSGAGIKGCTIFDTDGMGRELVKEYDEFTSMFAGLRSLLRSNTVNNKTLMMVLEEEKIKTVIDVIEDVVGDLDLPETGILFTLPLDFVKGIKL